MNEEQENIHFLDYWRVIRSRKEIIIAVFLVVVGTGFLVTYSMPKKYMASVVVQVEEETREVEVWQSDRRGYNPLFLRTQFEIIQSRPIMEEVIRRSDLDRKMAKACGYDMLSPEKSFERTVRILTSSMNVQQYRDTNLIEIQVTLAEPKATVLQEVADLSLMIADVYKSQRTRRSRDKIDSALKALKDSLVEREKVVVEKETKVRELVEKHKLDVIDTFNETVRTLHTERMRLLESMRITVLMDQAETESVLETLKSLSRKDLLDAGPYIVNDPALRELVSNKRATQANLSQAREMYGKEHPTVKSIASKLEQLDLSIADALSGLKKGAESSYLKAKAKYTIVEKELEASRNRERIAKSGPNQEYNNAFQDWERAKKVRDELEVRHVQEEILQRIPKTTVEIIEPPKIPELESPVSPNVVLNIVLSIIVGLGSGVSLAYFVEYLDTSVKTIDEIEKNMAVPVLGVIPQKVKSFIQDASNSAHAEAYRVLRTNIQFSKKVKGGKAFSVTSGSVGEGKSLTLFNLAYVCAQLGDRTLIVDADLHRPRQHKIFKVSNSAGLANVLVGEVALEDAVVATDISNLDFLPSGKLASGVHGLLDTSKMKDLVAELSESYDLVLFDSPPIIGISDASLLVREVDGVLLVIQHRKYPLGISLRAKNMVENLGGNLIGVVLNNINISRDYSYYYYHHHYYTYPRKNEGADRK